MSKRNVHSAALPALDAPPAKARKEAGPSACFVDKLIVDRRENGWAREVRSKLAEWGIVVLTNVVDAALCEQLHQGNIAFFQAQNPDLDLDNMTAQKEWEHNTTLEARRGLKQSCGVGNIPGVWTARLQTKHVFDAVYETEDLIPSGDGINLRFPGAPWTSASRDESMPASKDWAHLDQVTSSDFRCVQGQLILSSSTACFVASPKGHAVHRELLDACVPPAKRKKEWFKWDVEGAGAAKQLVEAAGGRWQIPITLWREPANATAPCTTTSSSATTSTTSNTTPSSSATTSTTGKTTATSSIAAAATATTTTTTTTTPTAGKATAAKAKGSAGGGGGGGGSRPLPWPPGTVILWDSRLPHSAMGPVKDDHAWRSVVYVSARPAREYSARQLEVRRSALRDNRVTNHWGSTLFPVCAGSSRFKSIKVLCDRQQGHTRSPLTIWEHCPSLEPDLDAIYAAFPALRPTEAVQKLIQK